MRGIWQYVGMRLLLTPVTILVLLTIIFLMLRVIPGDPVQALLGGRNIPPEQVQQRREQLGLNDPLHIQFGDYVWSAVQGDLGQSWRTGEDVLSVIGRRLTATLELTVFAVVLFSIFGLTAGIISARFVDGPLDHLIRFLNIGLFGTPIFWLGLMLILVFNVWLGWLPSPDGRLSIMHQATFNANITGLYTLDSLLEGNWEVFWDSMRHLTLPGLSIGLVLSGFMGRMTRINMIEVMGQDYIRSARAKGVSERPIVLKHALRNALIPIMTVQGLLFAILLGGAVLTESVFNWNGFGTFIVDSIEARDYPAIQGAVMFIALFVSIVNFLIDVTYALIDPRVKY